MVSGCWWTWLVCVWYCNDFWVDTCTTRQSTVASQNCSALTSLNTKYHWNIITTTTTTTTTTTSSTADWAAVVAVVRWPTMSEKYLSSAKYGDQQAESWLTDLSLYLSLNDHFHVTSHSHYLHFCFKSINNYDAVVSISISGLWQFVPINPEDYHFTISLQLHFFK